MAIRVHPPVYDWLKPLGPEPEVGIVAHCDDAEICAVKAILDARARGVANFVVVVVADGVGRPRAPDLESLGDPEMAELRIAEQLEAAQIGGYAASICLCYPSCAIKNGFNNDLLAELIQIVLQCRPKRLWTHNILDKHPTHIAVLHHVRRCFELLPADERPLEVFGGEVWGELSRLPQNELRYWDCTADQELQHQLLACFRSQNKVKDYCNKVLALRSARVGLIDPHHALDATTVKGIALGMDLTKLFLDPRRSMTSEVQRLFALMERDCVSAHEVFEQAA